MLHSIGVSYTWAEPHTGSMCAGTNLTRLTRSLFNRQPRVSLSHLSRSFLCGCPDWSSHRRPPLARHWLPAPCPPYVVRCHSICKLALDLGVDSQAGVGARSDVRVIFLSGALDRVNAWASRVSICCASAFWGLIDSRFVVRSSPVMDPRPQIWAPRAATVARSSPAIERREDLHPHLCFWDLPAIAARSYHIVEHHHCREEQSHHQPSLQSMFKWLQFMCWFSSYHSNIEFIMYVPVGCND
jgi:hypothetical protein